MLMFDVLQQQRLVALDERGPPNRGVVLPASSASAATSAYLFFATTLESLITLSLALLGKHRQPSLAMFQGRSGSFPSGPFWSTFVWPDRLAKSMWKGGEWSTKRPSRPWMSAV
ncbi:hypothetical protein V8C26DRAFT_401303 [Trichoderma gracile]